MSFDPILAAQLNKLKAPIGSALMVTEDFSDPGYLDAGSTFDPVAYPKLAAKITPGFKGGGFISKPSPYSHGNALSTYTGTSIPKTAFKYGGQLYVIFQNGSVMKSTDGTQEELAYFKSIVLPDTSYTSITTCAVANGMLYFSVFISAGVYASYRLDLNDANFATVTRLTMPSDAFGYQFRFGGGQILAVAITSATGSLAYSADGITFQSRVGNWTATYTPKGIDYGNGMWVIVTGGTGTANISTSPDGVTWTPRNVGTLGHNSVRHSAALNLFVTISVTASATVGIQTSPDGVTWTARATTLPANALLMLEVTSTGHFVASSGTATSPVFTSTNGTSWTVRNTGQLAATAGLPFTTYAIGLCYDDTMILFGTAGTGYSMWNYATSTDALATLSALSTIRGRTTRQTRGPVFISGGQIGLICDSAANVQTRQFYASRTTDGGETWSNITCTLPASYIVDLSGLVATPDRFYIPASPASLTTAVTTPVILHSADGIEWAVVNLGAGSSVNVAENTFVRNGNNASFSYSTDWGVTWYSRSFGGNILNPPVGKSAGPATFFVNPATLTGGMVAGSVVMNKGLNAYVMNLPATPTGVLNSAVYISPGKYGMTLVNSIVLYISEDGGINWIVRALPFATTTTSTLTAFNGCLFYVVGPGHAYVSTDLGLHWNVVKLSVEGFDLSPHYFSGLILNADGTRAFLGGTSPTNALGVYLEVDNTKFNLSYAPTPDAGLKWVIKAK